MRKLRCQEYTINSWHHKSLGLLFDNRKPELVDHASFQLHVASEQPLITASPSSLCTLNKIPLPCLFVHTFTMHNATNGSLETNSSFINMPTWGGVTLPSIGSLEQVKCQCRCLSQPVICSRYSERGCRPRRLSFYAGRGTASGSGWTFSCPSPSQHCPNFCFIHLPESITSQTRKCLSPTILKLTSSRHGHTLDSIVLSCQD